MMNISQGSFRARTQRWMGLVAVAAIVACAGLSRGQTPMPKTDEPPAADGTHPGEKHSPASDTELRKRGRELLVKGIESRKRELEAIEKALQLIDQGKTWEEVRTLVPELPRFGVRGEDRERWVGGRQQGGEDVNRLGSPGGGGTPQGDGKGMGPGNKPTDGPRLLTEEERATVREVLAATAGQDTVNRLRELEKTDAAKADQQYARSLERMRFLIDLRKRDRQMFDLKAQDIRHSFEAGALARTIADIDKSPAPDTSLRQQKVELLRGALLAQYNIRTQIMQRDFNKSAERAAEMTKEIQKRPAAAAEVVNKNLLDLIEREHRRRERAGGENGRGDRHGNDGKPPEPQQKQ